MLSQAPRTKDAYRLFYDDVVEGVRADLQKRLGSQKVPLQDVQREISALWKQSTQQEEYRKRAAELRKSVNKELKDNSGNPDSVEFPLHRLRKILDLDDEGPRVTKDTLRSLGKATTIFLGHLATRVHKHIVESDSSYPVKPEHIGHVLSDPRYPMYQFLDCSRDYLLASKEPESNPDDIAADDLGSVPPQEPPEQQVAPVPVQPAIPAGEKGPKKGQYSILNYFGGKRN